MQPIAKFIQLCEGESYVTISKVPKYLYDVMISLDTYSDDDTAVKLKEKITERLGFILSKPNFSLFAAALDPSVMLHKFISAQLNDDIWMLLDMHAVTYYELNTVSHEDDLIPDLVAFDLDDTHCFLEKYWTILEDPEKESRLLLLDPLDYWKNQFITSPQSTVLKNVVLCLFCICATSAPSERMFSQCGNIMTKLRSRMTPSLLEDLLIIKGYLGFQYFESDSLFETICRTYIPE